MWWMPLWWFLSVCFSDWVAFGISMEYQLYICASLCVHLKAACVHGFAVLCTFCSFSLARLKRTVELHSPTGLCFSRHSFAEHERMMLLYPAAAPAVSLPVPGWLPWPPVFPAVPNPVCLFVSVKNMGKSCSYIHWYMGGCCFVWPFALLPTEGCSACFYSHPLYNRS